MNGMRILNVLALWVAFAGSALGSHQQIATGTNPAWLAEEDGAVYWSQPYDEINNPNMRRVQKVAGGGGIVQTLVSGSIDPQRIVSDGVYVYFVDRGLFEDTIRRVWINGGPVDTLAPTSGHANSLILFEGRVYWADEAGMKSVPSGGGSIETHALSNSIRPDGIAVATSVSIGRYRLFYWLEGDRLRSADDQPGPPRPAVTLASGLNGPQFLLVYQGRGFDRSIVWAEANGRIVQYSNGNAIFLNAAQPGYTVFGLAADATHLFWVDSNLGIGRLRRMPRGGGSVTDIVTGLSGPFGIDLSSTHAYFAQVSGTRGVYRVRKDATAPLGDLRILGMEVTQAIQDLSNTIPLFSHKPTLVRVYPTGTVSDTPTSAVLYGTRNSLPLPGSPLPSIQAYHVVEANAQLNRDALHSSFTFELPNTWLSGTVTLRAEINPQRTVPESNSLNNSSTIIVDFVTPYTPCIRPIPVRVSGRSVPAAGESFLKMVDRLESVWPISRAAVHPIDGVLEELEFCSWGFIPYPCFGPYEPDDGIKILIGLELRDVFTIDSFTCGCDSSIVGLVETGPPLEGALVPQR